MANFPLQFNRRRELGTAWRLGGERRSVSQPALPLAHEIHHAFDARCLRGVCGAIVAFVGVFFEVEELSKVDSRIANQLPAGFTDGALIIAVSQEDRVGAPCQRGPP